jgi:nitrite reductase (cytochrome c-552)
MLQDQDSTQRMRIVKQPGACLQCHASVINAYRDAGIAEGVPAGPSHREEQIMKGFEKICAMPYPEARKLVSHPVGCIDCHDPATMELRVSRPGFLNGIRALARSDKPVPHLRSIEKWREGGRAGEYDVNKLASRQEMRSFVCGQCHVEYYFKPEGKAVTYPWANGMKMEEIESYYDTLKFKDWAHKLTGAPVLKAQHPEFETWSQGIHARSGVACADCHMPYRREGAVKVSDHHVRSPLLDVTASCQACHRYGEEEIKGRAAAIQDRTKGLLDRAEEALVALIVELEAVRDSLPSEQLAAVQALHRKAQWRTDYVAAENSMGFHAPQETARILAEAIDYARQGQLLIVRSPHEAQPATETGPGPVVEIKGK